jgi:enterochelin esterase-like enzyme
MLRVSSKTLAATLLAGAFAAQLAVAQDRPAAPPAAGRGGRGPQVVSPEIQADRKVTFRILAPKATAVALSANDIPAPVTKGVEFKKSDAGVWEATFGPIDPGAYRYNFTVDGVAVMDPRNPGTAESNTNSWSLFYVPGSDSMDAKNVPHGAVAEVTYFSTALNRFRRMHVYTPPGYELGKGKFPVFYLLHGAGDCDDAWTSVGRAGFIVDNLLAAKKAKPMIIVMPAGHTSAASFGGGGRGATTPGQTPRDEFTEDFMKDVMPYVESHYRVLTARADRAIAGLSMGGSQTLNIAIPHLDKFAYVGVYSSGLLGSFARTPAPAAAPGAAPAAAPAAGRAGAAPAGPSWEQQHLAELDNAALKKGLKVFWFATGVDDSLITTTRGTVDLLKKHGFTPSFKETTGAHTWINWRIYLNEFAPLLFQ